MKERTKKTGRVIVSKLKFILMFVGILILALLIKKAGLTKLWGTIIGMSPFYIMLAVLPWVLTMVLGAYRLKKIVNSKISFFDIFKIYSYGYLLNYASPVQGFGAGAKIAMLKMKNVKISKSSASVSSEIVYDIMLTLVVIILFFIYHINFLLDQLSSIVNLKLFFAGILAVLVLLAAAWFLRKKEFVKEFLEHLTGTFGFKNMAYLMPLTFLIWLLPAVTIYIIFIAAKAPIGLWIALGSLSMGFIFGLASFIPGGLGVRDAIMAYVYSLSGVSLETTISVTVFFRFFTIGIVLLVVILIKLYEMIIKR